MKTSRLLARPELESDCAHCAVCRRAIASGRWFVRIDYGGWRVALCSSLCSEVFQVNPAAYVCNVEMLAWRRRQHDRRSADAEFLRV